jgi:SAM-dependent methyltransferase
MSDASLQDQHRVERYYDNHPELNRLSCSTGKLEFARSKEIISRYLREPLNILDAGGATGVYSFWLASLGHRVTLVDLSPVHVQAAMQLNDQAPSKLVAIVQGSVMNLSFPAGQFDFVLNMGPMYHLAPNDRIKALEGFRRLVKPGGLMFSTYISRFASLLDGYNEGYIEDPIYLPIALAAIREGRHNPPEGSKYFTIAYMHRPEDVGPELESAGFKLCELLAVEGPFWAHPRVDAYIADSTRFAELLRTVQLLEKEPSILGASAHFLAVSMAPT